MLEVANLEVVYNEVILVLRGLSIEVPDDKIVALLGANGAGKTTTLRAVGGLLDVHEGKVTKGTVRLNGESIDDLDASARVRAGITQVMEGRRIFSDLTVDENLAAGAYTNADKASVAEAHERVMTMFPALAGRRKSVAGYLSGGEQQMLAIGRALMLKPKLLLLDEPSLGLSPILVSEIFETIKDLHRSGVTILLVEQNVNQALQIADYGYVLTSGKILLSGTYEELKKEDRVKEMYLGEGKYVRRARLWGS